MAKIKYASKDTLPKNAFDSRHTKFRVTMFVDLDVLDSIRSEAKEIGLPYQTYINQLLRKHADGDNLESRVSLLERSFFKKSKPPKKPAVMHSRKR